MSDETPEPGIRCKVKTSDGEEIGVWTGHMWASEDGSRLLDGIESWEPAPHEDELRVIMPDD